MSVIISAVTAVVVAVDVSAAESPGSSNSNHTETKVTVEDGEITSTITTGDVETEAGTGVSAAVSATGSETEVVTSAISTDSGSDSGAGTGAINEDDERVQLGSDAVGAEGSNEEVKNSEESPGLLSQTALANIRNSAVVSDDQPRKSGFAPIVPAIASSTPVASAATDNNLPEAPSPFKSGGLSMFTALLSSTVMPVIQQIAGDWRNIDVASGMGMGDGLAVLITLFLGLIGASYVWRLRKSGYSHGARSDVLNFGYYGTPRVSFAWVGTTLAQNSLFCGGKSGSLNYGAI